MPICPEISLPELTVFNAEIRSFTTQTVFKVKLDFGTDRALEV
jgi:hypothetical protein